jgi:hypothetical protein
MFLWCDFGLNRPKITKPFQFELSWFLRPDLVEVVKKVWFGYYTGKSFIDFWKNRAKNIRSILKEWNYNWNVVNRKGKKMLLEQIDCIDRDSEVNGPLLHYYNFKKELETKLSRIYKEEVRWLQRSKEKTTRGRFPHYLLYG